MVWGAGLSCPVVAPARAPKRPAVSHRVISASGFHDVYLCPGGCTCNSRFLPCRGSAKLSHCLCPDGTGPGAVTGRHRFTGPGVAFHLATACPLSIPYKDGFPVASATAPVWHRWAVSGGGGTDRIPP